MVALSKRCVFLTVLVSQLIFLATVVYVSLCAQAELRAKQTPRTQPSGPMSLRHVGSDVVAREVTVKSSDGEDLKTESSEGSQLTNRSRKMGDRSNWTVKPDADNQRDYNTRVNADVAFQPIDNKEAWLYSAYFDHVSAKIGKPLVRVFGVVKSEFLLAVFCHFNFDHKSMTTSGLLTDLPESHNRSFLPAYVDCSLPIDARPLEVSISFDGTAAPTNRLQVQYPGANIRNFTVCYSVLHSDYNMASLLIQSIEMNRILGAEHFVLYNHSISPLVGQVLRRYQQEGLVTVLHWPMPTLRSWYLGQMTAINDCIYRNRNISRYVVVVDTDELIIPRNYYTWLDVFQNISAPTKHAPSSLKIPQSPNENDNLSCCFIFRSSIFNTENNILSNLNSLPAEFSFTEAEKANILNHNFSTLAQFRRSRQIFQFTARSKYIACPEKVAIAGVHYVHNLTDNRKCVNIGDDIALVHHYRKPKTITDTVLDTSIIRFKTRLYPRLMKMIDTFHEILL